MTSRTNGKTRAIPSVIVCGGAGFIGTHLCNRLLEEGQHVICVDDFRTSDESAVDHLLTHPNFELRRADIAVLEPSSLDGSYEIYNLACAASPVHYQSDPLGTLLTSIRGMHILLRAAERSGARIFQASTSEVYGHPTVHPQTESYWGHVNPVGPRACYDEGKRCAETLCYIYREQYGVQARIGRIFNTYGPGMRLIDGRVVINFIVQALEDEPLTVYGDGTQTRSFCFVEDLVEGIRRLMDGRVDLAGPINFGNPVEIEIGDLAERIVRLTNSRSQIVRKPLPVDDPPRRRPDISLAARELGWHPATDLDSGLALTIRDVERRLRNGYPGIAPLHRPRMARPSVVGASVI